MRTFPYLIGLVIGGIATYICNSPSYGIISAGVIGFIAGIIFSGFLVDDKKQNDKDTR